MANQQGQTTVRDTINVKEPDMYDVIMLNDDFTSMEFVVRVLKQVFYHPDEDAERLMLCIHRKGSCTVGTYTFDIAESKVMKTTQMARAEGFPLRLRIKPHE